MRSDRLIAIMLLLQARGQMPATELASDLVYHRSAAHETGQRSRKAVQASRRVGHRRPLHSGNHNRGPSLRYSRGQRHCPISEPPAPALAANRLAVAFRR